MPSVNFDKDRKLDKEREIKNWAGTKTVRTPICPFGCGEPGILIDIVQTAEGTIGIYKDPAMCCTFQSMISAKPKPNTRKLVVGPDGELTIAGGE